MDFEITIFAMKFCWNFVEHVEKIARLVVVDSCSVLVRLSAAVAAAGSFVAVPIQLQRQPSSVFLRKRRRTIHPLRLLGTFLVLCFRLAGEKRALFSRRSKKRALFFF